MKKILTRLAFALGAMMVSTAAFAGVIVTSPGLGSTSISWSVENTGPSAISSITFNLSTTSIPLVIDPAGAFSLSGPAGGTANYFQNTPSGGGFSVFGFNFTPGW